MFNLKFFFLIFLISFNPVALKNKKKSSEPIKCDSIFEDSIEINEREFEFYDDHYLKSLYNQRNSNIQACLNFYSTFFTRLDEIFESLTYK